MADLFWIPHPTEIWAVAKRSGASQFVLEKPMDSETAEPAGTVVNLGQPELKSVLAGLKSCSGTPGRTAGAVED